MHASILHNSQRVLVQGVFILAVLLPAMLFAQGYFGTVSGVLTDASGAIVQGAKVTLLDEQKGYQFSATSDNKRALSVRLDSAGNVFRDGGDAGV